MVDKLKMALFRPPSSEKRVIPTTGTVNESPPRSSNHRNLASLHDAVDHFSNNDVDDRTLTGYKRHQEQPGDPIFKKKATKSHKNNLLESQSESSSSSSSDDDSDGGDPSACTKALMTSRRLMFSAGEEEEDDDHSNDTDHYSSCVENEEVRGEFVEDRTKGCDENQSEKFVGNILRSNDDSGSRTHESPAILQKKAILNEVVESTSKTTPTSFKKTFNIKIPKTMVENTPFKVSINDDLDTASWSSSEWHITDDKDEEEKEEDKEESGDDFLELFHHPSKQGLQHADDEDEVDDVPFVAFDDDGEHGTTEIRLESLSSNRKTISRAHTSMIYKPRWSFGIFFIVLLMASGMIELPKITFDDPSDWIGFTSSNQTSFVGVKRPSRVWSAPTTSTTPN